MYVYIYIYIYIYMDLSMCIHFICIYMYIYGLGNVYLSYMYVYTFAPDDKRLNPPAMLGRRDAADPATDPRDMTDDASAENPLVHQPFN